MKHTIVGEDDGLLSLVGIQVEPNKLGSSRYFSQKGSSVNGRSSSIKRPQAILAIHNDRLYENNRIVGSDGIARRGCIDQRSRCVVFQVGVGSLGS